jgi:hypothetical protein
VIRSLVGRSVFVLSLLAVCVVVPSVARAQAPGTRTPVANNHVVSTNPFLLMLDYGNVEFERKHTETRTFGASVSRAGLGEFDYTNVQGFYRYYPQQAALTGFYIGGRGGMHHVSGLDASGNFFGMGVEIGYGWLFGARRNFAVSLGGGVNRLFGGDLDGASLTYPTARLVNVGWSF